MTTKGRINLITRPLGMYGLSSLVDIVSLRIGTLIYFFSI